MGHTKDEVFIALIQHRIVDCSAESLIGQKESKGGKVEFSTTVEFPDTSTILRANENYNIFLKLDCTGKDSETKDLSFKVSCKMAGLCKVMDAPSKDINSYNMLWLLPINQLYSLLSQFTTELLTRMGFKNINVPPAWQEPAQFKAIEQKPLKIKRRVT